MAHLHPRIVGGLKNGIGEIIQRKREREVKKLHMEEGEVMGREGGRY